MSLPRYPNYKDSGVEWLGEVPGNWEVWKLSQAFEVIGSGTTPKSDNCSYYDEGHVAWLNTGDLNDGELDWCEKRITPLALANHSSLKIFPAGSLVIAMYGATIGKLAILLFPATVNQACCVFAGKSPIETKFMFYWFLGLRQQIISLATGGGQPNVSQEILRSLRIACPGEIEQTQIAAFLDRETAKIDGLVAEQRRLMTLLKEKRQAVISHAVTRGLNPDAPLKPSGIEWLGDVPEHWDVLPAKRVSSVFVPQRNKPELNVDGEGLFWVTMEQMRSEEIKSAELSVTESAARDAGTRVLLAGAVVASCVGTFGLAAINSVDVIINQQLQAFIPTDRIEAKFMRHCVVIAEGYFEQIGTAATIAYVNQLGFANMPLVLPPKTEQHQIVEFLAAESTKLNTLTTEAQRAIDLLQERRTALISAAVTGQIDVRGVVAI
jgi:restriction endonuclease S subunit